MFGLLKAMGMLQYMLEYLFFILAVDTPNIGPKTVFTSTLEAQFRASIANSVRFDGKNSSVHHRESLYFSGIWQALIVSIVQWIGNVSVSVTNGDHRT